jgi:hypothetical protein
MTALDTAASLLENYALAWRTHDEELVRRIFSNEAVYCVEGKKEFNGIEEIVNYWRRNKGRQKSTNVHPIVKLESSENFVSGIFCSQFEDTEERENQTVYGRLRIDFFENKISRLEETYGVNRIPVSRLTIFDRSIIFAKSIYLYIYSFLRKYIVLLFEIILLRFTGFIMWSMALLLGYSAYNLDSLPDVVLCLLNGLPKVCNVGDPDAKIALTIGVTRKLASWTAFLIVVLPLLLHVRYSYFNPIKRSRLYKDGDDLEIMFQHYSKSKGLTVFSGSFGFVGNDERVFRELERLNDRGSLRLVSSKSEDDVRRGFGTDARRLALFDSLRNRGAIVFDTAVSVRCSLLERWDGSEVLYKHSSSSDGPSFDEMCVVRGKREMTPPVTLIRKLANAVTHGN